MNKRSILLPLAGIVVLAGALGVPSSTPVKGANGVPGQIEAINKSLATLQGTVSTQGSDLTTLKGTVGSLQSDVSTLSEASSNVQTTVSTLQSTVSQQGTDIGTLKSQIADIQSKLTSLTGEINNLQSQLASSQPPQPPKPPQGNYSFEASLVDANGNPFFCGGLLTDANGNQYPYTSADLQNHTITFGNLPNGTYTINFYVPLYHVASPTQVTIDGASVTGAVIRLSTPTYTISGKALASDGTPLAGKQVTIAVDGIAGYWPATGADGSFNMIGMPPGTYPIQIGDPQQPIAVGVVTVTNQDVANVTIQQH